MKRNHQTINPGASCRSGRPGPILLRLTAALALLSLLLCGCSGAPGNRETTNASAAETAAPASAEQPTGEDRTSEFSGSTEAPAPATERQTEAPVSSEPETETPEPEDESWKLILVNASHPLPEPYEITLKELRNGHRVDERIYPELQQMFDDARAQGIHPFINESFRTAQRQQQIMDQYIAGYIAQGMGREEAERKARQIVAVPGTSEHQLGLALDIIAEFDADSTATWSWLKENSWRYGFILRYPADKEEITGISFEPWHFRYVGAAAAKEITERGICLEEYVQNPAG